MKIRAITSGLNLSHPLDESKLGEVIAFNQRAKETFENNGYEVQSTRIITQPWSEYLGKLSKTQIIKELKRIDGINARNDIAHYGIGTVSEPKMISLIPDINKATESACASATIGDATTGINHGAAKAAAAAILRISKETENGEGNFRFAAISNCPPFIPFLPAGYHGGEKSFGVGMECSDLVSKAFDKSKGIAEAEDSLKSLLESEFGGVEEIARDFGKSEGITFNGIDVSIAPSLEKEESIAYAFEKLGIGKFGEAGTLAIAGMITGVLKSLKVKKCGYSGLMLPIMEDHGLAQRFSEGSLDISKTLLYSAVCGTGLDCVPLPGEISEGRICAILLDMATMSIKLNKPLSARLFPVPGKKAGDMTKFNSPYLVNCRVPRVD